MKHTYRRGLGAGLAATLTVLAVGVAAPVSATENNATVEVPVTAAADPDCPDGPTLCGDVEVPGTFVTACAHAVIIERWIPGTGTVELKGARKAWMGDNGLEIGEPFLAEPAVFEAGYVRVADKVFDHEPGERADFCGDDGDPTGALGTYAGDTDFSEAINPMTADRLLNVMLWGTDEDGMRVWGGPAWEGYPLGNYGYRLRASSVTCTLDEDTLNVIACDEPRTAIDQYALGTMTCEGFYPGAGHILGDGSLGWPEVDRALLDPNGCTEDDTVVKDPPPPTHKTVKDPAPPVTTAVPDPAPPIIHAGAVHTVAAPAWDTNPTVESGVLLAGLLVATGAAGGLWVRGRRTNL